MSGHLNHPFGRELTEAEADIVMRNRHLGWDGHTLEEARQMRDRTMGDGLDRYPPPARGGDVVGLMVLMLFAFFIGLGAGLWWAA